MPESHNEIAAGLFQGPVVQAGRIDHLVIQSATANPTLPRVVAGDALPRELGVHAAIGGGPDLPAYVERDLDPVLRSAITARSDAGCFLLLVGPSSAGKTRSAYEAVRACVPDWWLVQPADADEARRLDAASAERTVVWMDELQRFFGEKGVNAATVRNLCRAGAIVIGTLWPDEYLVKSAPRPSGFPPPPDLYRTERELLAQAHVIDVDSAFSETERARALELATVDPRIRLALDIEDAGVTQTLAAGPALVRWWDQAHNPYGKAIITAASDARRLGAGSPVPRGFLSAAAAGYLTPTHRATATTDWFDGALAYALTPLHGAATALIPATEGNNLPASVIGYTVADYLFQHIRDVRKSVEPPEPFWQAVADHITTPADQLDIARTGQARGHRHGVEVIYRNLVSVGVSAALAPLAGMLDRSGRLDEAIMLLWPWAESGNSAARDHVIELLRRRRRWDEAAEFVHGTGNVGRVAAILVESQRIDDAVTLLRRQADGGDTNARVRLAELLIGSDRLAEAVRALQPAFGVVGDTEVVIARQFAAAGYVTEAVDVLCHKPADGLPRPAIVDLLARHGHLAEIVIRAETGDEHAQWHLINTLATQSRLDELDEAVHHRANLAFTDHDLEHRFTDLLVHRGMIEHLQHRADHGHEHAQRRLAGLLLEQGRFQDVAARAEAGDRGAAIRLATHLVKGGEVEGAIRSLSAYPDLTDWLVTTLISNDYTDHAISLLRRAAEQGDHHATEWLNDLEHTLPQ